MAEPLALLHGAFLPAAQAHLSLNDSGFVLGATVTDLCRTFQHRLFRFEDHLQRFRTSLRLARFDVAVSDASITAWANELVEHNARLLSPASDLALVLFATPGPIGYYLGEPGAAGDGPVSFGMHTFPLPFARYRSLFTSGAKLWIPRVRQVPSFVVDPNIKQRSRLHYWLADREVRAAAPGALALLVNENNFITETAAANFLLVRSNALISPRSDSILQGVSRQVVRELAREIGVGFVEENLTLEECLRGDEAMITSTTFCLAGVASLQGHAFPWPGKLTQELLALWSSRVGVDIVQQALALDDFKETASTPAR